MSGGGQGLINMGWLDVLGGAVQGVDRSNVGVLFNGSDSTQ